MLLNPRRRFTLFSSAALTALLVAAPLGSSALASGLDPAEDETPVVADVSLTVADSLTLPDGDGFRDATTATIVSDTALGVSLVARLDAGDVPLGGDITLEPVEDRFEAMVPITVAGLVAGTVPVDVVDADTDTVLASGAVVVSSGTAQTVSLVALTPTTVYPYKDGNRDTIRYGVEARDELGLLIPFTGTITTTVGKTKVSTAISSTTGTAEKTVTITSLARGTGSAIARVTGPAPGAASSPTVAISSAATTLSSLSLSRSAKTVYPVKDGYQDSVSFTVTTKTGAPFAVPVTGSVSIVKDGRTIKKWALPSKTGTKTFTWNGKVGTKIVPGTYTVKVTAKGPEGSTLTKSTTVVVSPKKLVTETLKQTVKAGDLLTGYETYDLFDLGTCLRDATKAVYCYSFDAYYTDSLGLIADGVRSVPSVVKSSAQYGKPSFRVTAKTSVKRGIALLFYGHNKTTTLRTKELAVGNRTGGWLSLGSSPSRIEVGVALGEYTDLVVDAFVIEYKYTVLK